MSQTTSAADLRLGRRLVLDELFDLSLYQALRAAARSGLHELIAVERRHFAFWQQFFGMTVTRLDGGRRLKLALIVLLCRLLGAPAIHLVLEAIEVHGVRKYLQVWERYRDGPLGAALRDILEDEFKHEDATVAGDAERRINPERVRNIFLGLNDGLVEILGAVSGFFAAFGHAATVLMAGVTVGVAGALSMAAGAYVPVLPVLFGAHTAWPSVIVAMLLAFLSGMNVRRRVVTYLIGIVTKAVFGIAV